MQSNSEKRGLGGRVLAAGFVGSIVGAIVGALVMGFMPSARGQTPNGHIVDENRLAVELYLQKQKGPYFEFVGCRAREGTNPNPKTCVKADAEMSTKLSNVHFDAVVVRWNGQSSGSGCAKVGGVEYCW
jgi:hypothetical protein